ncbi:MAG TPA: alpha/beta hydrolase [Candidatus Binatia bacterium]|jgi:pimeloyl-ACP methyl ester carboxylesterase
MISSRRAVARFAAPLLVAALLCGCATSPIGVKRMDADAVQRSLTANALTENEPSIETTNVLHRRGLYDQFQTDPVRTLAELHRIAVAENDDDTYFALAELSFLYADRSHNRDYSIMAALYAWSFLFGGHPLDPVDPRLRVAIDLYNRGLTQGYEQGKNGQVVLSAQTYTLPIGKLEVYFDPSVLEWHGRHLGGFIPVAELQVSGLDNRFRTPGIGAPLAANAAAPAGQEETLLLRSLKIPVTALVRIDDVRKQIASGTIRANLELHTDPNEENVRIADRSVPLEKEPSAVLASMVAEAPVIKQELLAFIGTVTQQRDKGRLGALTPHVRGRIPIVFVHGTASSPARWAEMVNVLMNDPRINERYEAWVFAYNSSSPILYSGYLLRKALSDAVASLDPDGTDTGLQQMVVIGHSQGGLLTKLTAVDSGDAFWRNITSKRFEDVHLDPKDRELLGAAVFVKPLPFVKRVVFICTPHRGSFLAVSDWVRGIVTRVVSLPATVTRMGVSVLTLNPDMVRLVNLERVNAVENMTPGNPFLKVLVALPIAPGIAANSIIAVKGNGPLEQEDDGVVKYTSAHLGGVESEKIVHSTHSTQAVPETIEEVRRILLLHAAKSGEPEAPVVAAAMSHAPKHRLLRVARTAAAR